MSGSGESVLREAVSDIADDLGGVISIHENDKLGDIIQKLSLFRFSSFPVLRDGMNEDSSLYLGVLDLLDLLAYVVYGTFDVENVDQTDIKIKEDYEQVLVKDLIGLASHVQNRSWSTGLYTVPFSLEIKEVIKGMLKDNVSHSFVEYPKDSDVSMRYLSFTDILRYISLYSESFDLDMKVEDIMEEDAQHVMVDSEVQALQAYKQMMVHGKDAIAVMDRNKGRLLTTLTASDLRHVFNHSEGVGIILESCMSFLNKIHNHIRNPIYVSPKDSIKDVVYKLSITEVHRIWVLNDQRSPIGSITITNILNKLSQ